MTNDIRETLRFEKATITELSSYPGEKGVNNVLVIKASLTLAAAKVLKCENRFFNLNDQPLDDYTGRLTLKPLIKSCVVKLQKVSGAIDNLQPTLIWKFNIGLEKDKGPSVIFRLHFDGYRQQLADILEERGTSEFPLAIEALQANLFEDQASDEDGPEGGTRIDMSPEDDGQEALPLGAEPSKAKSGCNACDAGIPTRGDDDAEHVNGQACARWGAPPPVPTAAERKKARLAEEARKRELREASGIEAVQ